jgi:CubicO group peptidase (beta-lactamase class C family)
MPSVARQRLVTRGLLSLAVSLAVLVDGLAGVRRAQAGGAPPAEVVAAVTAAYGHGGVLAVVVARQQQPGAGPSIRAVEARAARLASHGADNGAVADRPFPSASMVKLFLAEDVLRRARAGALVLTPEDRARLAAMIRSSDDPAASAIWVRFGGAQAVRDVSDRYDLSGTEPPSRPGQWGETITTARDLARFLSLLPVLAHPEDAASLMRWMRSATPLAGDGFDQRFGLFGADLLGTLPGRPAVKQGWMCCVGGVRHLHSVAVVGNRVVVLLSEVPRAVGYDQARAWLTAAAVPVAGGRSGG